MNHPDLHNPMGIFVFDYVVKQNLRKLGYVFSGDELSDFDVTITMEIASELTRLEREEINKAGKHGGRKTKF